MHTEKQIIKGECKHTLLLSRNIDIPPAMV